MSFATSRSAGASPSETVRVCDNFKVGHDDHDEDKDDDDDDDGEDDEKHGEADASYDAFIQGKDN